MKSNNNKAESTEFNIVNNGSDKKTRAFDYQRILFPVIYLCIVCIIAVPLGAAALKSLTAYIHDVQKTLSKGYYDCAVVNDYSPSKITFGVIDTPAVEPFHSVGVIELDGVKTDVYYGVNRVTLRRGVAVYTDYDLPGQGGKCILRGYMSSDIDSMRSMSAGSTFTFTTNYGVFDYKVSETALTSDAEKIENISSDKELLILSLDSSDTVFANYDEQKLYIICEKISGPASEVKVNV